MNERNRVFGNNVKFLIVNGKFNEQTVAEHLGYSKYDLWKLWMDGYFWVKMRKLILQENCRQQ